MSDKIGGILVNLGYVQDDDVKRALEIQKESPDKKVGEILAGWVLKEEQLMHALSIQNGGFKMDHTLAIVSRLLRQRLNQSDIRGMLDNINTSGPEQFIEKISNILEKTAAFFEISYQLSDSLSLDIILQRIIEITNEAMNTDRGTLFLNDRETQELYSRIAQGDLTREIRFPNHMGIAGAVFTTGQPIIIHNAYADPRFNKEVDKQTGYRTRNILCSPVRTRSNEIIGVIQLLNKIEEDFTSDDLIMLEAITSQASTALLNVQLFEQVKKAREEETKLLEVTTAISTELKLEPLLFKIMSATTDILEADRSTLFMHDERTDELWALVAQGTGSNEIRFPSPMGIAGQVFTKGETINIPDAYLDNRFNQDVDKKTGYRTRSILCMPIITKEGKHIGALQVLNKKGGPFTHFDEKRLGAFAAQASIAIENAKLFEDVLNMKNYNESILESMSNGVITLNAMNQIVKTNRAAEVITQQESAAMHNHPIADVLGTKNPWILEALEKMDSTGQAENLLDIDFILPDGEHSAINLTAVPLKNIKKENIGTMLLLEDITQEKRLKGTMARYMTKEVAERLLDGGETILGGQIKEATIFFSDIRSFTTISETLGAQETVSMLNEYFTCMVDIIFSFEGILDKYIGDAILAVFGTPFSTDQDADNAVTAAVEMMRALKTLNAQMKTPIEIGIGINTDEVLVGNIGSMKRMDYTVIGDGVNLASRLESANKFFGSSVLVSGMTMKNLKKNYLHRELDRLTVKGKTKPVPVYEILDYHDRFSFPNLQDVIHNYGNGLTSYRERDWKRAMRFFEQAINLNRQDLASKIYLKRCQHFLGSPPPENWDGSWEMAEK